MSLAAGETHGNGVADEFPSPKGLNVFCAELMGGMFDPFGVRNFICWRVPIRGLHPRLMILFPFGELISANLNALSSQKFFDKVFSGGRPFCSPVRGAGT